VAQPGLNWKWPFIDRVAGRVNLRRFTNACQLMAYLGLVPSEHSSGSTVRAPELPRQAMRLRVAS
jgi:transposase